MHVKYIIYVHAIQDEKELIHFLIRTLNWFELIYSLVFKQNFISFLCFMNKIPLPTAKWNLKYGKWNPLDLFQVLLEFKDAKKWNALQKNKVVILHTHIETNGLIFSCFHWLHLWINVCNWWCVMFNGIFFGLSIHWLTKSLLPSFLLQAKKKKEKKTNKWHVVSEVQTKNFSIKYIKNELILVWRQCIRFSGCINSKFACFPLCCRQHVCVCVCIFQTRSRHRCHFHYDWVLNGYVDIVVAVTFVF